MIELTKTGTSKMDGKKKRDWGGGAREGAGRKRTGRLRKPLAITFPEELIQRIDVDAAKCGQTRTKWLEKAAEERLNAMPK